MTTLSKWVEENRAELSSAVADGMLSEMTFEQMRQYVWDSLYDDLTLQSWSSVWDYAEKYAPEFVENFENASSIEA